MEILKNKKKQIAILSVVSIILSIILEFIMVNNVIGYTNYSIARIITITGLISFIGLHFVLGIKKLYGLIIENRYKISGIMIIISAILGFFMNSIGIKEWIFTTDKVLSLWWNLKFYSLILASYELFFIITNKNKSLSIVGTIVLAFSGVVQLNFTKIDSLILGEIITVLFYKLSNNQYNANKIIKKDNKNIEKSSKLNKNVALDIIIAVAIVIFSICYTYTFRPYAVAFGYVFVALIIWILIKNKKVFKENKSKCIILISTLLASFISLLISNVFLNKNTSETLENITYGISGLFSYLYNCLLPFYNFENKEMFGNIISVFPIPMCVALYYMYKNDKHAEFLLPLTIISVIETIFCISGFPEILEKITLFSGIGGINVVPGVALANLFIMFYFLENIEEDLFKVKHSMRITVLVICLLIFISYPNVFSGRGFLYLFVCVLSILSFMFLNYKDKKYQKVFLFFLILITLVGGIPINFII